MTDPSLTAVTVHPADGALPRAIGDALAATLGELDDAGRHAVHLAVDPEALPAAAPDGEPGASRRALYVPSLAGSTAGLLEDLDLVMVPHAAAVDGVLRRGAPRARVEVVGIVGPPGFAPAEDRAAARSTLGLEGDGPVVVVEAAALAGSDLLPGLVQLSLVRAKTVWLLHVGDDPELADRLRRLVPGYGLAAWMFAHADEVAPAAWAAADAVLGQLDGPEMIAGAAVGAALVSLPPPRDALAAAHALETAGLVEVADAAATLAVTLDGALGAGLEAGQAASRGLGDASAPERVRGAVESLRSAGGRVVGLPVGLERLADEPVSPVSPATNPDDAPSGDPVERELAALRDRLGMKSG